ncbi:response regulator [Planctomycetota bacterium]
MRILIADDHAIVREGLTALFKQQPQCEVVGQAKDGQQAVALCQTLQPEVAIMDISMPKLSGVEAIRQLHHSHPDIKVIVLSMHSENTIVSEALKAGCWGYVLKSSLFEEIATALETVMAGDRYLSPEITSTMVDDYLHPTAPGNDSGPLTDRERQIVQLLAQGKSVKESAQYLGISPKTVDATRRKAMHKLEINSVALLTKYAIRAGLTSIES